MSAGDVARAVSRTLGELLVTAGLVVLLFAAHLLWGTGAETADAQAELREEIELAWAAAPAAEPAPRGVAPVAPATAPAAEEPVPVAGPEVAGAVAVVRVPAFGPDYAYAVVEGVTTEALKKGPGHMPGTALPGEVGNVVLSGHRTTYGAPFADVGELVPGDAVVLETADGWHVYRVRDLEVVPPTAVEVTLPVPRQPGVAPTERLLTLTTCHPRYSARQRLVVTAVLDETRPRATGAPAVLAAAGG